MIPLEEIYEETLFKYSLFSYWQVPKRNPTLKSIEKVRFERFKVQHIFGRDDNFMLKTKDGNCVSKLYNFYGYSEMSLFDRVMHVLTIPMFDFKDCLEVVKGDNSTSSDENNTKHFRDTFYDVERDYYYFKSKEEAYTNYAMTKATENNNTDKTTYVESQILDTYPEMFV